MGRARRSRAETRLTNTGPVPPLRRRVRRPESAASPGDCVAPSLCVTTGPATVARRRAPLRHRLSGAGAVLVPSVGATDTGRRQREGRPRQNRQRRQHGCRHRWCRDGHHVRLHRLLLRCRRRQHEAGRHLAVARQHDHLRPVRHAGIKVDDVLIDEPDAARRGVVPDRFPFRRAVDAIAIVAPVGPEVKRARAERVGQPAGLALFPFRKLRPALDHLGRRRPFRPGLPVGDLRHPRPLEPRLADGDAIARRVFRPVTKYRCRWAGSMMTVPGTSAVG